ncbi:MAG: hypothetical protein ACKVVP_23350, partial [Chloroflexota bacterium]
MPRTISATAHLLLHSILNAILPRQRLERQPSSEDEGKVQKVQKVSWQVDSVFSLQSPCHPAGDWRLN